MLKVTVPPFIHCKMLFKLWSKKSHSMPFSIIRLLVNSRHRKLQYMMFLFNWWYSMRTHSIGHMPHFTYLLSLYLIGMLREQGRWVTSRVKLSTVFNNKRVLIMCVCVPDTSVRCLKGSVCLSRTDWRWMLPPRRQTLGWLQVCWRLFINRYFLYSRITPHKTDHIISFHSVAGYIL